ncbi:MAG: histidine phosphotransferase family protein [Pseudomonadota bacterium]
MLDSMTLSALLTSRVCHDLISPVAAMTTGLEVMEEESDEEMRQHAMDLLNASAAQASAKLQFVRLAFGAAGTAGAELDLDEAKGLASGYFDFVKPDLDWRAPGRVVPKSICKIVLNLCLLAAEAAPRGGHVRVLGAADGPLTIVAEGPRAFLPETARAALAGDLDEYDAKSIQPYYVGRLIDTAGQTLTIEDGEERVTFILAPAG